jgi:uncharacterized protein with HEPN domain
VKDDRFYLLHIRDALADLAAYASPGRDAFFAERLRQDGIIRKLEVIGEAVKGLSADARARRPEIPWRQIAGMRDKIAHEYFGVNLELVWMVVEGDLPALQKAVSSLLGNTDDDGKTESA